MARSPWRSWLARRSHNTAMTHCSSEISGGREFEPHRGHAPCPEIRVVWEAYHTGMLAAHPAKPFWFAAGSAAQLQPGDCALYMPAPALGQLCCWRSPSRCRSGRCCHTSSASLMPLHLCLPPAAWLGRPALWAALPGHGSCDGWLAAILPLLGQGPSPYPDTCERASQPAAQASSQICHSELVSAGCQCSSSLSSACSALLRGWHDCGLLLLWLRCAAGAAPVVIR